MRGDYGEPWGVLSEACFSFVSTGVRGREKGICDEENEPVAIGRRIGGWLR